VAGEMGGWGSVFQMLDYQWRCSRRKLNSMSGHCGIPVKFKLTQLVSPQERDVGIVKGIGDMQD